MTTKTLYLLASFLLLFAGGFISPDETISWLLVLLGCVGFILYTLEKEE